MSRHQSIARPPGPRGHWLLGHIPDQVKNPLGMLVRGHREYGYVVNFRMFGGVDTYLLCHPEHAQHVLADNARNYPHPEGLTSPLLGQGLFTSRGDFWMRQRRMVQPAFHRPRLAAMVSSMAACAQTQARAWQQRASTGEPMDVLEDMRRLAISLLGTAIFSSDVRATQPALREAVDFFAHNNHAPLDSYWAAARRKLKLLQGARMKRVHAAHAALDTELYGLIAERRRAPEGRDDVLTMLLEARDAQGEGMTDLQVRDELVALYMGGQESTAVTLTWLWYVLASRPEVEQQVRAELATVLGGRALEPEDLPRLRYTRAVVDEVLRVYSPAWQIARQAQGDDSIGGWTVPAGTVVLISPHILHRHPSAWHEPERFNPERFLGPEQKEPRHRYAYLPFGAGQRLCVGNNLALTLIVTAVATLLQHHHLRLVKNGPPVILTGTTYRPRDGLMATLQPASLAA